MYPAAELIPMNDVQLRRDTRSKKKTKLITKPRTPNNNTILIQYSPEQGAKGDWDFRISDLIKNPDGTDI